MQLLNVPGILVQKTTLDSVHLQREVTVEFFLPKYVEDPASLSLLLINDGQNMEEMQFEKILAELYSTKAIRPLFCAAIHAGKDRKMEYGIASQPDYLGRGARAADYTSFVMLELLPFIHKTYAISSFADTAFAGFSLGALMALDIAWEYPGTFQKVGVFSGSLWWRNIDQTDMDYNDDQHRIMHQLIRKGTYHPGQRFFFQSGNMDETNDRNNNGIIDSIDDTMDLISELEKKGFNRKTDIFYLELADGKHDIPTWGRAMPEFLKWAFSK